MDDAVGVGGGAAQDVEVVEGAAEYLGPGRGQGGGRAVGACEPDDLVAAPMSSGTTAEPIQPDAPVTRTRMGNLREQAMSVNVITLARPMSVTVID
ncbi:hypothetical protein [Actinomadura madurae]|uniref:hypothetical protein n=1 Tax=Actinomadura madurae TaxID=1993 RepID=UPI0020D1FE0C|nr:hypothetical protein [Actinomadura madurae]MCP9970715.1 hypothetical protein [Actinomadura madurae]MCP9983187.1 hypothetical protein [Actinomadura madurae]